MTEHLEKWTAYCEARVQHEQMKEAATEAYKLFKRAETELVDAMLEADPPVSGVPDACGASASMRQSFNIACNQDNADQVEQWLRDTVGDAEQYKKTALDKAAVTAHVKQLFEGGEPLEDMPAFLNVSTRPTITVREWWKKKKELTA